jgi:UDP-N-acetylmuramate dehydrogenase
MSIFNGLEKIVKTNCSLSSYTWYGVGGAAEYMVTPTTIDELSEVMRRCHESGMAVHILGFGSNLLVGDEGVKGVVLKLEGDEFCKTDFEGTSVKAGAGAALGKLVLECVRQGLGGLEALTGIPGSIGGSIKMNAGGKFGDIGSAVESVTLMDSKGEIFEKSKPELSFDYRSANIGSEVIVGSTIKLVESDSETLLRSTKEIWIYKKNSQPLGTKNAGCVFKNPRGMSAGALIDRAGFKDTQIGGAKVSDKHANFILTEKDCSANDIKKLIDVMRAGVMKEHGVEMELEIEMW